VVPDASPAQLAVDIRLDVPHLQADVQVLAKALGSNTSAGVQTDINNLNNDLSAVLTDLQAGRAATGDVIAAIGAEAQLRTDLGSKIGQVVRNELRHVGNHLTDLSGDVNQINRAVSRDLSEVQADAQELTNVLANNPNPTVQADIKTLNNDLSTVASDLSAGQSAISDLNKVKTDAANLANVLGQGARAVVRRDVRDLRNDLRDMSQDLNQITNTVNRNAADIEADAQTLTNALASNPNQKVQGDVNTLNSDLSKVAADLEAGKSAASDLNTVITDATTLFTDLGTNVSSVVQQELKDLRNDLMDLAIELAALKV
jgi:hypothetical protein